MVSFGNRVLLILNCYNLVTRECLCNGTWGPDPCQTTLSIAEDLVSVYKSGHCPDFKI